jgi:hypothetical protein
MVYFFFQHRVVCNAAVVTMSVSWFETWSESVASSVGRERWLSGWYARGACFAGAGTYIVKLGFRFHLRGLAARSLARSRDDARPSASPPRVASAGIYSAGQLTAKAEG